MSVIGSRIAIAPTVEPTPMTKEGVHSLVERFYALHRASSPKSTEVVGGGVPQSPSVTSLTPLPPKISKRPAYERAERARRTKRVRQHIQELKNRAKMKPCADCGKQYNPWVMDFDHRDQSTKKKVVSQCRHSISEALAEIAKCDVVCANCHRERTQRQIMARERHIFP